MNNLPKSVIKLVLVSLVSVLFTAISTQSTYASSAYVSPTSGLITVENFKVSFYVESTANEPEIAGAHLKITYPENISVVSVNNGEFDSYLEKVDNPATKEISINAVNNAGNYKSGKVKLASVDFKALANTGQVQLIISSSSEINGSGGEQLLTETINGVYSLSLPEAAAETTVPTTPAIGSSTVETTVATVPATGIGVNNIVYYLAISSLMIVFGVGSLYKKERA